jgi:hypothetical protein
MTLFFGPDQKGKKGFQGKEPVGFVPLGLRLKMTRHKSSQQCKQQRGVATNLYFACYLQVWSQIPDRPFFGILERQPWEPTGPP